MIFQEVCRRYVKPISIDSCFLTLDLQLFDLTRFCTNPGAFCARNSSYLQPIYIGKFYVTITKYTYLQLMNKVTGIPHTSVGPVFVHTEKSYEAYYFSL